MSDKLPWGLKTDALTPGSMKNISSLKLKAFNIGTMNIRKGMSKKEQEEMKKKEEQEAAAKVYAEFVESFEDTSKSINRSWIKGGVVNPDKAKRDREAGGSGGSRLYKPPATKSLLGEFPQSQREERQERPEPRPQQTVDRPDRPGKAKKVAEKKKSNLELFKEELQRIQEERQERRRNKSEGRPMSAHPVGVTGPGGMEPMPIPAPNSQESRRNSRFDPLPETPAMGTSLGLGLEDAFGTAKGGYTYNEDMQTTNLYLGNLNPKMSEPQLCELFGKFGPLASVKIMWPRSDEERSRGRNCGFVAYMNRKDGERALNNLQGRDIEGFEMKLGWGKAVPIPPHPVYVPPALAELALPPPPSGLPFNCQPTRSSRRSNARDKGYGSVPPPMPRPGDPAMDDRQLRDLEDEHREFEKTLSNAVVKVVIPTERPLLQLIHRVIEFVVREGPMFEAMIMNREMNNPQFRFLFENQSPAHVYYRWKLFSILQGDEPYNWRTLPFRMFKGGSLWQPPIMNPYSQGMPEELVGRAPNSQHGEQDSQDARNRGMLSESQRDRLEDMLRELSPEKQRVGDAMVWCLEHAESAEEIVECLAESLSLLETPIPKKIARLYLVSDILHNCSAKVPHASYYRKFFETKLPEIFKDMNDYYEKISGRLKAEQFKTRVMACFRAWEDWAVYPNDLLIKFQNIFLGLVPSNEPEAEADAGSPAAGGGGTGEEELDGVPLDVDGLPLQPSASAVDLDGMPLTGAGTDYDVDGEPLTDVDGAPLREKTPEPRGSENKFIKSKWEEVDESELEAQAVTTSKWEQLAAASESGDDDDADETAASARSGVDLDGAPMDMDGESYHGADSVDGSPMRSREESRERNSSGATIEMTEERRAKLREIELKVMKYHDELEAGKRTRKPEMSFQEQVQYYRTKLLNKEEEKEREKLRDKEREKQRREEEARVREWERARNKERERELREKEKERERLARQIRELSREEKSYDRRKSRGSERSRERGSERRDRQSSSPEYESPSGAAKGSLGMLMRYGRSSTSRSPSPASSRSGHRGSRSGAATPSAYTRTSRRSRSRTPKHSSSKSLKSRRRSKSRSPTSSSRKSKRTTRSRSKSPGSSKKHKKHKSRR